MPLGKKWPTPRVRTTTSMRVDSPRRTVAGIRSRGANSVSAGPAGALPRPTAMPCSSPTAKVVAISGPSRCSPAPPPPSRAASVMAKMSTVTWLAWRKRITSSSCSSSRLAVGRAVLAAAKRCDWIRPFSLAASSEGTRGMWQSTHFIGSAG